jgi:hypothetical protein
MRDIASKRLILVALMTMPLLVGCNMQALLNNAMESTPKSEAAATNTPTSSTTLRSTTSRSTTTTTTVNTSTSRSNIEGNGSTITSKENIPEGVVVSGSEYAFNTCDSKFPNGFPSGAEHFAELRGGSIAQLEDNRARLDLNIRWVFPANPPVTLRISPKDRTIPYVVKIEFNGTKISSVDFSVENQEDLDKVPTNRHLDISIKQVKEDGNGTLKIYLNSDIADDFGEKSIVQMTSEQIDTVCKGA